MGQKVNPVGLRLGINKTWKSKWYVDPREYAETLHQDLLIRNILSASPETASADVAEVEIVRHPQRVTVIIHTGRPGAIIGVKGANIEKLGAKLAKNIGTKIQIKIKEVKRPELNAQLIAMNVARQLKARASFRRALRMAIQGAMRSGIQGIKIKISGRLGGAEMARTHEVKEGRIPLHTFRANIDYGFYESNTTFGKIGVKVWVFHGEIYGKEKKEDAGMIVDKKKEKAKTKKRETKKKTEKNEVKEVKTKKDEVKEEKAKKEVKTKKDETKEEKAAEEKIETNDKDTKSKTGKKDKDVTIIEAEEKKADKKSKEKDITILEGGAEENTEDKGKEK